MLSYQVLPLRFSLDSLSYKSHNYFSYHPLLLCIKRRKAGLLCWTPACATGRCCDSMANPGAHCVPLGCWCSLACYPCAGAGLLALVIGCTYWCCVVWERAEIRGNFHAQMPVLFWPKWCSKAMGAPRTQTDITCFLFLDICIPVSWGETAYTGCLQTLPPVLWRMWLNPVKRRFLYCQVPAAKTWAICLMVCCVSGRMVLQYWLDLCCCATVTYGELYPLMCKMGKTDAIWP